MPVYNTELYIARCLNSIIEQTFENIEIIAVNDGSKDDSLTIIKNYAIKYDNIKVIDQENKGPAEARRAGVEISNGDYVMFVDSDDWLPNNALELLYNKCIEYNLDYARGTHYVYFSENYKPLFSYDHSKILVGKEFLYYTTHITNELSTAMALYKRSILQNDVFPPSHLNLPNEDYFTTVKMALYINRAGIFNDIPIYYYYQNPNSISKTGALTKFQKNWTLYYNEVRLFFDKHKLLHEFEERLRILEVDKIAFHVAKIDTNDNWYKKVCGYDSSKYPIKYKILHFLIKYPILCKIAINTNRKFKRLIIRLKCNWHRHTGQK